MSTSATQFSEADVDIRNTQKNKKKITQRMSTSTTQFSEADVYIRNTKKQKNYKTDIEIRNTIF